MTDKYKPPRRHGPPLSTEPRPARNRFMVAEGGPAIEVAILLHDNLRFEHLAMKERTNVHPQFC
jgi:hypothetical protein